MKQNYFLPKLFVFSLSMVAISNCKTPYQPSLKNEKQHFLVVEGYLNGNGTNSVKLSRTRSISSGDTANYIYEDGANVRIEDSYNNVYPLYNSGQGIYTGSFYLEPSLLYRLHITTADNREYLSDSVSYKPSPPIDNISWKFDNNSNVQVSVSTHDPQNNTRYYRWDYDETWEFHSQYYSVVLYDPKDSTVKDRTVPVYQCWRVGHSTNILLGSSAKLKEDVIDHAPLTLIPFENSRISVLYSILVTQYALDSSGYNYWKAMKSNTESVGSIFDPQPNQTQGNIHCLTDSSETVIGYVSAGTTEQSRFFISNSNMPASWNQQRNCSEVDVTPDSVVYYFGTHGFAPIKQDGLPSNNTFGASETCVDCTLTGSPVKPSFWP